jgi:hypothetical protein
MSAAAPSRFPGGVLLAMAGVGAGFVIVIGAGFYLSGQPAPSAIANSLPVAVAVLAAVIVVAAKRWRPGRPRASDWGILPDGFDFHRPHLRRQRLANEEARRQRLAALAADPIKCRYVKLIEAGHSWSDAQIAYDLDRCQTATCPHLQPIERALRDHGLYLRRWAGPDVEANAASTRKSWRAVSRCLPRSAMRNRPPITVRWRIRRRRSSIAACAVPPFT